MSAQNPTREELLAEGVRWRESGKLDECLERMLELTQQYPDDAAVAYQTAWIHDRLGAERDAVPYYRKALASGTLCAEDRIGAMIGCASTLRVLGEYDQAVELLESAVKEFPDDGSAKVFLAMALYNLARHHDAMNVLLRLVAETSTAPGIKAYRAAIVEYAEDLDGISAR